MSERQCPRCRQVLGAGRFGPLEIDICRSCGGVLFDAGELSHLNSAGPQVVRRLYESINPQPPACPSCGAATKSVEFAGMPGVRVDACTGCEATWVSHATLVRLAEALDSSRGWAGGATANVPPPAAQAPPRATPPPAPGQARPVSSPYTPPPAAAPPAPPPPAARAAARPAAPAGKAPAGAAAARPGELICPHCKEPNSDRAAVCWACGKALEGPVVGICPRCDGAMRRRDSDGVTLDACEGCGSVCVNPRRLQQLILQPLDRIQRLVELVSRFRAERSKTNIANPLCPHCKVALILSRMGMLTQKPVHSCPQCFGLVVEYETLRDILLGQQR